MARPNRRGSKVETAGSVFLVREDEPAPRVGAGLHRIPFGTTKRLLRSKRRRLLQPSTYPVNGSLRFAVSRFSYKPIFVTEAKSTVCVPHLAEVWSLRPVWRWVGYSKTEANEET